MRIDACFDSHVHWPAVGEFSQRLRLDDLSSPREIKNVRPESSHFRESWLLGFGWDENGWTEKPHRRYLDDWFPNTPVALSRCDAHALWVNTETLKRSGLWTETRDPEGGRIDRDETGQPTGLLIDAAMDPVQNLIPRPSAFETRRNLLKGMQSFNEAGYTHIRDMTCDETQWNEALKLDLSGVLTMAVEEYFWLRSASEFDRVIDVARRARASQTPNLRVKGIKVFVDGALGSEGALLSRCYHGRSHSGLQLWSAGDLQDVLRKIWTERFEVAVHVIGDEAADVVVKLASDLKTQGVTGALHLEHCELLRPETVQIMRPLNVTCHLQPAHWLSDRLWLEKKIGDLCAHAFPWRRLQEAEIPFFFGSDAPIEPISIPRMFRALRESAESGVPRLLGQATTYMSHADTAWAPNSFTLIEEENPVQVVFRGEHLI